ncbi:hypothetical protein K435DRAFT_606556, partial [Dendrothele bispora CBS 962.96]
MIARCRAKCCIIKMKANDNNDSEDLGSDRMPFLQRGMKGNIIVFPQQPSAIASVLPPSLEELAAPICIRFVGSTPPSPEWLRTKTSPLAIRPGKVRKALEWLKKHNRWYRDVEIDYHVLNGIPENGFTLPVDIEHIEPDHDDPGLTSGYDNIQAPNVSPVSGVSNDPQAGFEKVVITDVNIGATANQLRAAAVRHVNKNGGAYLEVAHDAEPASEFDNPSLFPMMYLTLFPYGLGGFEDHQRSVKVSKKRHIKHL